MATVHLWPVVSTVIAPLAGILSSSFLIVVYISPVVAYLPSLTLVTISPGRLIPLGSDSPLSSANGPTIRIGLLGSCTQQDNDSVVHHFCTTASLSPTYDLSSLPNGTPPLSQPSPGSSGIFLFGMITWAIFNVIFTLTKIHQWLLMPQTLHDLFGKPRFTRINATMGFLFGSLFVLASTVTNFVVFSQAVNSFNNELIPSDPAFHAGLSNGFNYLWTGIGLSGLPLLIVLADLHFVAEVTKEKTENAAGEEQAARKWWARAMSNRAFTFRWLSRSRIPPPDPQPRAVRNTDLIKSLVEAEIAVRKGNEVLAAAAKRGVDPDLIQGIVDEIEAYEKAK